MSERFYKKRICKKCLKEYRGQGKTYCSNSCSAKDKKIKNVGIKGIKRSFEANEKIRKALKGRTYSQETLKRMSEGHKGMKVSEETRKKMSASHPKGNKNINWKGGITPINKKIRNSVEYKLWRESVYKRDNYTCVWCLRRGVKLNADHIKPFALFPELRFAIDNGRTLCVECHKKTDTYAGKTKNK